MSESGDGYGGMTVNERLFVAGLLEQFDTAIENGDRQRAIDVLQAVELNEVAAASTVEAVLSGRNMAMPGSWTATDAWVLAAITDRRKGCSLTELIGTMDALNHAIPTRDELTSSIGALAAAGLIAASEDQFRLTHSGKALKKHWKGGMFNWGKTLLPFLTALPRSSEKFPLTEADVQSAYATYHQDFQRRLKRMK